MCHVVGSVASVATRNAPSKCFCTSDINYMPELQVSLALRVREGGQAC